MALRWAGINVITGVWRDRVALGGGLKEMVASPSLFEQFPVLCNLRTVGKVMAYRWWVKVSDGKHKVLEKQDHHVSYYRTQLNVHHFKWVAGARERLERTEEQARQQGAGGHRTSLMLSHLQEHNGICLGCSEFQPVCCGPSPDFLRRHTNETGLQAQRNPFTTPEGCDVAALQIYGKWGTHDSKAPWL